MTIRKLLTNLPLYVVCLGFGGIDGAADSAAAAARSLVAGERLDLAWVRAWRDCAAFDCACLPHDSAPVAPACAND